MVNSVFLVGRIGKKPELQTGKSGKKYCRFGLATYGRTKKDTMWHDVTCFGKTAENVCKFMDKGAIVSVDGSIQYGEFEKDGVKHRTCAITANTVTFITYPKTGESAAAAAGVQSDAQQYDWFDDIPNDDQILF